MASSGPVRLTLACNDYDRTRALHNGRVRVTGAEVHPIRLPASEIFVRMTRDEEFDVAEMSLSMFLIGLTQGDGRFVGLPIFPLRAFRHRDIYVARDSNIGPRDLVGRAVGLRHFHMSSAVWQRGILSDDYGLTPDRIHWVRAEVERPGPATPRVRLALPDTIAMTTVTDRSLAQMVESGELAAGLLAAAGPGRRFAIRRLFDDARAVERGYFRRTGIYPIMHLMVIRRDRIRQHPWLATELLAAFEAAKQAAHDDALSAASPAMGPFHVLDLERDQAEFGPDLYPYGLAANRATLETFRRYSAEQSLTRRPPAVADWFDPEAALPTGDGGKAPSGHRTVDD